MQAIILAGGQGTRLRALYPDRPKALAPILNRPFIVWQLDWLAQNGITHVHFAAGHKADVFKNWLALNPRSDMTITLSTEPHPLGTGGGLKFVEPYIQSDSFWVLNGDSLLPNLNFQRLENFAKKLPTPVLAVMAVTKIEKTGRYGTIHFDADHRITSFEEKRENLLSGWVNGGVYLMEKRILNHIPENQTLSMEEQIFPRLIKQKYLYAFEAERPLLDMGTPDGLAAMENFFGKP